jgi:hypothetical protein
MKEKCWNAILCETFIFYKFKIPNTDGQREEKKTEQWCSTINRVCVRTHI